MSLMGVTMLLFSTYSFYEEESSKDLAQRVLACEKTDPASSFSTITSGWLVSPSASSVWSPEPHLRPGPVVFLLSIANSISQQEL
jgi:hypothetical protein